MTQAIANERDTFHSHDLGLVTYLLCLGKYELVGMDKSVRSRVTFILSRDAELNHAIEDYWNCKTSVDAQTLFNQLKRLKNQIYSD